MDAVKQRLTQFTSQLHPFFTQTWYILRSFKTTGVLFVILVVALGLGLIISQQPEIVSGGVAARVLWTGNLPSWLQPVGNLLFSLGFARIFHSFWFWLPAALLLLNSLIALADYAPGSWLRLGKTTPPVEWQHPLAHRIEISVRLSNFPDNFMEILEGRLGHRGFVFYEPPQTGQRVTGAAQQRWAWLGVVAGYVGLIVLVGAFLVTFYTLQTERFTLSPFQPRLVSLLQGSFELTDAEGMFGVNQVTYTPSTTELAPQILTWQLYQPTFLGKTLILPVAAEPILTVKVWDATDNLLELAPPQKDTSLTKQMNLLLGESYAPLYFRIPAVDLTVQILPDSPVAEHTYNVQVLRGSEEAVLVENIRVQAGQVFEVDKFSAIISLNHKLTVVARRDSAWPFYLSGIILILAGGVSTLWRSPAVVWLIPEVKGMGGQLYGVMEQFGSEQKMAQFLAELLLIEDSSTAEEAN